MPGSGWQIDVAGVQTVLNQVQATAQSLGQSLQGAVSAVSSLEGCFGGDKYGMSIAAAADALMQSRQDELTQIGNTISACLGGAGAATQEYINGDEQMAANAQAQAATSAANGDFSMFNSILGGGK